MSQHTSAAQTVVVGIGASAGGLEAFQLLLTGLPDDHDLALVLVQHLDPDHESLMPELVAAKTKTPVHSVTDGMQIEPGHIYLNPPGYEMEVEDGRLRLKTFASPRGLRRPIDRFLTSLAGAFGENAIAVILSGTGSDGANGAREVKGAGGLVFVQDPRQAKYSGMPQSVLDLGGADVTSKAEEIIDVIGDYFSLRGGAGADAATESEFLERILRHVRFRTGHDFVDYKDATMLRRINVRMSVLNITDTSKYLKYLVDNKKEADQLFRDLLINVTSFFRDTDHFEALKTQILPELVENAPDGGEIRIWVAGCATGEEAYSLAILLSEEISRTDKKCNVVIFGTDIDDNALAAARLGRYPDSIVGSVGEVWIDRYFTLRKEGYEVGPKLREMVRFSRHSFIKDPPFSKLDMVSCRNVMIYLKDSLQDTSCRVFHYALKEDGVLFIGPSEHPKTIGNFFEELSGKDRIFKRRPGPSRPLNLGAPSPSLTSTATRRGAPSEPSNDPKEIDRVILDEFAPAYFHVDQNNEVIFSSKGATRFFAVRAGRMSTDLYGLVAPELETAFRRVARLDMTKGASSSREFQGEIAGQRERLVISARRLADGSLLFVIKDNLELQSRETPTDGDGGGERDAYIGALEAELDDARQEVRTTVEELETTNEELKSSNEEMMSMNEELQSANEELTTINDELQEKLRELNQANVDLKNFVGSARVATVFLDEDLTLLRYTPEAEEYFRFTPNDVGRPILDLATEIDQAALVDLFEATIADKQEREEELLSGDDTSLAVRIMPYSPDGGDAFGVVFTLQDVTELRQAIRTAEEAQDLAEERLNEVLQIYNLSPMAMGLISRDMRYLRINERLAEINGEPLDRHIGRTIRQIIPTVADHTENLVKQVFDTEEPVYGERVTGATRSDPDNERIWESDWLPFYQQGEMTGVSVHVRDVTTEIRTAENLRRVMKELEHRVKNMLANIGALVNRARSEAKSDRTVFETLSRRIQGLANTHSLLTREQWASARLKDVMEPETIEVYGEDRVTLDGPDLRVNAEATLAIGMAIHELATNASKYGAFSTPEGEVALSWSRINDAASDRIIITWQETGGPNVTPPDGSGFGSQLIKSTIEGSLGGEAHYNWEPTGLRVVMELSYERVTE